MRFWVGIIPPKKIYKKIIKLQKNISEKYSTYHAIESRIGPHITLTYQENVKSKNLKKIEKTIDKISKETMPFEIKVKGIGRFNKFNVIYARSLKTKELINLQKKISFSINRFGRTRALRKYTPHITLIDVDIARENFKRAFKEIDKNIFYEFTVDRIYVGKSRARIKVYKSFKLKF